jgi:hypothetical protein
MAVKISEIHSPLVAPPVSIHAAVARLLVIAGSVARLLPKMAGIGLLVMSIWFVVWVYTGDGTFAPNLPGNSSAAEIIAIGR